MCETEIRWLVRKDLPAVLDIERKSFQFAWNEMIFIETLKQSACIGMVAERDDEIVGYAVYWMVHRQLHILNMAVDPLQRRTGVGTDIINRLKNKLAIGRRNEIVACTRERNLRAQLFLKSQGFRAVDVLRNYYDDNGEDAYQFRFRVGAEQVNEWETVPQEAWSL